MLLGKQNVITKIVNSNLSLTKFAQVLHFMFVFNEKNIIEDEKGKISLKLTYKKSKLVLKPVKLNVSFPLI